MSSKQDKPRKNVKAKATTKTAVKLNGSVDPSRSFIDDGKKKKHAIPLDPPKKRKVVEETLDHIEPIEPKGYSAKKALKPTKVYDNNVSNWQMEIVTQDGVSIKKLIDNIRQLLTTVELRFLKNGIFICSIDMAKYALICIRLESSKFLKYYCPKPFRISIDIERLQMALNAVGSYEELSFIFADNPNHLIIDLKTEGRQFRYNRQILFGNSANTNQNFRPPMMMYTHELEIDAAQFQTDIRNLCQYAKMAKFMTDYKMLRIAGHGPYGSSSVDIIPDSSKLEIEEPDDTTAVEEETNEEEQVGIDLESEKAREEMLVEVEIVKGGMADSEVYEKFDVETDPNVESEENEAAAHAPPPPAPKPNAQPGEYIPPGEDHNWDVVAPYVLKYIYMVAKNVNLSKKLKIMIEKGKPIIFKFDVNTLGSITFCILNCEERNAS
jgi:hypothetical protein